MNKKFLVALVRLILVLGLIIPACSQPSPAPEKASWQLGGPAPIAGVQMPKYWRIMASTGLGGGYDLSGEVAAKMVRQVFPDIGVRHAPGLGATSFPLVNDGGTQGAEMAIGTTQDAQEARTGTGRFKTALKNISYIGNYYTSTQSWMVSADSGINSYGDLKNKRVYAGSPGGSVAVLLEALFKNTYGFDYAAIKAAGGQVIYTDAQSALDMFSDGKLDAIKVSTVPWAPAQMLMSQRKYKMLSVTDEELKNLRKVDPAVSKFLISGKEWGNLVSDYWVWGYICPWFVTGNLPDDVVYNISAALFSDTGIKMADTALVGTLVQGGVLETNKVAAQEMYPNLPMSWHPGAVKYWKARGLIK